jgi:hypothetical protein
MLGEARCAAGDRSTSAASHLSPGGAIVSSVAVREVGHVGATIAGSVGPDTTGSTLASVNAPSTPVDGDTRMEERI